MKEESSVAFSEKSVDLYLKWACNCKILNYNVLQVLFLFLRKGFSIPMDSRHHSIGIAGPFRWIRAAIP